MAKKLDQILIIDVESTCWGGSPPPGQESEIIEIGVCLLDVGSRERVSRESILVKPQYSTVSPFCTQLTTLTQAQVDAGIPFKEACALLKSKYLSKERTWASYGNYDRRQFERKCQNSQIGYPFGPTHLNVKNLFALTHGLPHEIGMAEALAVLDLPLTGTHHRGGDDAWNIAQILAILLERRRL
jgi:inhibitor of KinA sporulation pathway (predicted exonuclease)